MSLFQIVMIAIGGVLLILALRGVGLLISDHIKYGGKGK